MNTQRKRQAKPAHEFLIISQPPPGHVCAKHPPHGNGMKMNVFSMILGIGGPETFPISHGSPPIGVPILNECLEKFGPGPLLDRFGDASGGKF